MITVVRHRLPLSRSQSSVTMVGHRWSIVGRQSSLVGRRASVVGRRPSVGPRRSSVVDQSVGGRQSSVVARRSPVVDRRSSVVGRRSPIQGATHRSLMRILKRPPTTAPVKDNLLLRRKTAPCAFWRTSLSLLKESRFKHSILTIPSPRIR